MGAPHFISKFAGLTGSVNPYSDAPEGGARVLDNCVIRSKNIIESRRGYAGYIWVTPLHAMGWKDGVLLGLTWDDPGRGVPGIFPAFSYIDYSQPNDLQQQTALPMNPGGLPFDRPGGVYGQHTRFVAAQKAVYFQSRYGLTKVETLTASRCAIHSAPISSDGPVSIQVRVNGAGNAMANNTTAAYRFTNCRLGANKELIESEPSGRVVLTNTSGTSQLVQLAPAAGYLVAPDCFLRAYRTKTVPSGQAPDEEYFLVAEFSPNVQFSNGYVDANGYLTDANGVAAVAPYTDATSDLELVGMAPLYTNPVSGAGSAAAKYSAPLAADMAMFRGRLLCLNTTDVHRTNLLMIGTGTGGIVDGSTITVDGVVFTFRTTPVFPRDVPLYTGGTSIVNRQKTTAELAWRLNLYFGSLYASASKIQNVIVARCEAFGDADAGQIVLQRLVPGAAAFTTSTNNRNGWGSDYTAGLVSDPSAQPAGLSWSEPDEPEAFPLSNSAIVGDAASAGQRVIALKEAALIFKANNNNSQDGLWRWTDDGVNYQIQLADPTVRLIAPETAQPLGGYVFALCDQGVMLFTENGQSVNVSHDEIERDLLKLIAYVGRDTLAAVAFAVPNELDGEYILCLPEAPNAVTCTIQYVYNVRTQEWYRWKLPGVISGTVNPNTGQLTWGTGPLAGPLTAPAGTTNLWVERRAYDSTDYYDPPFNIASPVTTPTRTMVFSGDKRGGLAGFDVGDLISQAQPTYYVRQWVKSVTYSSSANQTTVTLDAAPTHPWVNTQGLVVDKAIQCVLGFLPFHGGRPLTTKEWGDCLLLFRYCDLIFATADWSSETYRPLSGVEMIAGTGQDSPAPLDKFASTAFDSGFWDRPAENQIVKATLPSKFGECALLGLTLRLGNARCRWELAGINLSIAQEAEDVVR